MAYLETRTERGSCCALWQGIRERRLRIRLFVKISVSTMMLISAKIQLFSIIDKFPVLFSLVEHITMLPECWRNNKIIAEVLSKKKSNYCPKHLAMPQHTVIYWGTFLVICAAMSYIPINLFRCFPLLMTRN